MRRVVVIAGGVVLAAFATTFACTFPNLDFAPDTQFVDGTFVPSEDGNGSSSGDSSSGTLPDGGNPDGNPCSGPDTLCDCDNDGDKAIACDGGDCNDLDPRISSKVTDFVDLVPPGGDGGDGDWNCDGRVEKEGDAGFFCATVFDGGPVAADDVKKACEAASGFQDDVGCGVIGTHVACEASCSPGQCADVRKCRDRVNGVEQRPRGCR